MSWKKVGPSAPSAAMRSWQLRASASAGSSALRDRPRSTPSRQPATARRTSRGPRAEPDRDRRPRAGPRSARRGPHPRIGSSTPACLRPARNCPMRSRRRRLASTRFWSDAEIAADRNHRPQHLAQRRRVQRDRPVDGFQRAGPEPAGGADMHPAGAFHVIGQRDQARTISSGVVSAERIARPNRSARSTSSPSTASSASRAASASRWPLVAAIASSRDSVSSGPLGCPASAAGRGLGQERPVRRGRARP